MSDRQARAHAVEPHRSVIVQAPAGTDYAPGTAIGSALPPEHTYFSNAETGEAQLHRERLTL